MKDRFLWLRGNLHTHSTRSDGKLKPQALVDRYADLGYDFLALSDHDVVSDYQGLDPRGMVLLPANEVSGGPHVLHLGALRPLCASSNQQQLLDDINADRGMAILNHPNCEADFNHYSYEALATLKGYVGIEICNGSCIEGDGSHLATDKWDRLLSAGRTVWGFANDDTHLPEHIARGWNVVAATDRTPEAITEALRSGRFYASSGVSIDLIECDGPILHLVAPRAEQIALVGASGRRFRTLRGGELRFDASDSAEPFIRVECYGREGAQAWTQPFHIRDGLQEQRQLASANAISKSTLHALRSNVAPQLTGELTDPIWQEAEPFDGFRSMRDGTPAPVRTQVRAIAAGGSLYFAFRCSEPEIEKLETDSGKALWMTDSVEVFLDPDGRGMRCYQIGISAGGSLMTASRGSDPREAPPVAREGRPVSARRRARLVR